MNVTVSRSLWSYNDQMPIVPLLDVGLWPLLQLTLLVPAAVGISVWRSRRRASVE